MIPEAEATSRLAVVDLDWDHVSAEDILAIMRSFLQRGQAIRRVAVYPSDYGLQVASLQPLCRKLHFAVAATAVWWMIHARALKSAEQ